MSIGIVCMIRIVVGALAGPGPRHHGGRGVAVHPHVPHGGGVGGGVAGGTGPVRLVDHRLDDPAPCIDEPVVDLQYGEAGVLCQLFLLVLRGVGVGQVLEQPGP